MNRSQSEIGWIRDSLAGRRMQKTTICKHSSKYYGRFIAPLIVLSGLFLLVACQGVGAGGNPPPPPASTGQLNVAPATLGVGSVVAGTSGTAPGTLSAIASAVTITAISTTNSAFSVGGISLPVTIQPGQSIPFSLTFSPQTAGAVGATITFTSNAQPSTSTETVTGTGMPAPTHSVNLSWSASVSPNISGYNVYRAGYSNSCGGYSKINSVLNTSTLYTDSSVADGASYCYAATAVNSGNQESGYSNVASAVQIPAP
jgi:hypothetical protein